jgi:Tol biopolymer transport system component
VTLLAVLGGLVLPGAATHASCRCRAVADYAPVWSPDDAKIAYTEAYEAAHVASPATGDDSAVAAPTPNVVWAPDWHEAAAVVNDNARGYLLTLVRLGGTLRTLDAAFSTLPAWSPDSRQLAYIGGDEGLYIFDEALNERRLIVAHVNPYWSPAWSPDGSSLAFVSGTDVFVVEAVGGATRDVTQAVPGTHVDPVWSPEGDALAVNTDFGRAIDVIGLDGTVRVHAELELPAAYTGLALSWSPSGDRLVYSHHFDPAPASPGVYELTTATGAQRRLTAFGLDASYSHDGSRIAFGGTVTIEPNPPNTLDCVGVGIWTIPAAGGAPTLVARTCKATSPTVSIHGPRTIDYGEPADLSGGLLPGFGPVVDLGVRPCGRRASSEVAVADGGAWSETVRPAVTTGFAAAVGDTTVSTTVGVRPVVVLRQIGTLTFEVRIRGGRSFAGRTVRVELQQQNGKLRLLRRLELREATRARFGLKRGQLHPWLQSLYVAVPRAATGPCLEPAVSNPLPVSRP